MDRAGPIDQSSSKRITAIATGLTLLFHGLLAGRYDLFRDELYFIVCGQHPAFGYADQPPLVPLLAAWLFALGHGSAWLVRLPVVLAAGALVWVTARLAAQIGGSRLAVTLAALAAAIAPMLMGVTGTLNTSAFDPPAWTLIVWLLVRAIRLADDRALLIVGLVAGIDLQIKYALVFWAACLALGLLLTPQRRLIRRPALWLGLALAAAIALPSALWQAANGLPFLELGAAAAGKNAEVPLGSFLLNQVMVMNPLLSPLWLAGLVAPFLMARFRDLRFLPLGCLSMLVLVRLGHGKDYYLAPLYPALFAVGSAALTVWFSTRARQIGGGVLLAGALAVSAVVAPIALPILPPPHIAPYMAAIGFTPQQQEKSFAGTKLPQQFADQLGWRTFAAQADAAWQAIPSEERSRTAIVVGNYGEAAALDLYGAGLPPVLSGHNQYYLWGLRGQQPRHLLLVTDDVAEAASYCGEVRVLCQTHAQYAMAYENGLALAWCRDLKIPLEKVWPQLKHFE